MDLSESIIKELPKKLSIYLRKQYIYDSIKYKYIQNKILLT